MGTKLSNGERTWPGLAGPIDAAFLDGLRERRRLRRVGREAVADFARRAARDRLRILVAPAVRPFVPDPSPHFHAKPELFLQLSGYGRMVLAEDALDFGPGDLVLIPRGVAHEEVRRAHGGPFLNLVFAYSDLGVVYHASGATHPPRARMLARTEHACGDVDRLCAYLDDAGAYAGGSPGRTAAMRSLVHAHLALLAEAIAPAADAGGAHSPLVQRARHLVSRYLCDTRLSVVRLAALLDCSADHLSHRFRVETGMTLTATINRRRMDFGAHLLRTTAMSVAQVARASGYTDPGYFARVFRRLHGTSPRRFRAGPREG